MSKIGFDKLAVGISARYADGADVRGPSCNNAIPGVMMPKFIGETAGKIVYLSHIYRVPRIIQASLAEDVGASSSGKFGAYGMVLEFVADSASTDPDD